MIFLSYNHMDRDLVSVVAAKLAIVFGQDNVFFDDWSISPGEGIIDKMNKGLGAAKFIFFFVSKSSLQSKYVEAEWQNGLVMALGGELQLVPVKIDDCVMPPILLQNKYIDLYGKGLDVATRQIIDVANGAPTAPDADLVYENVRCWVYPSEGGKLSIEIKAITYMEPQAKFALFLANDQNDFSAWERGSPTFQSHFEVAATRLTNGSYTNALFFERQRALSPGFPYILEITPATGSHIQLNGVLHAVALGQYRPIPVAYGRPDSTP